MLAATLLLVATAALFVVARHYEPLHWAWGYVAAFAGAATVGGLADWYAVVALFRRPLGLPIPHTAIIPSNKDRIGAKLAGFICNNFLSTAQVLAKLREFDPAGRMAEWLARPASGERLGEHRVVVVDVVGHFQQIRSGQREAIREAAVASEDAQHRPAAGVLGDAGAGEFALGGRAVDRADDALADPPPAAWPRVRQRRRGAGPWPGQ